MVSALMVTWKHVGATDQLQSGRAHKLTEWGHRVLKSVVYKNHIFSKLEGTPAQELCIENIIKCVSMAEWLQTRSLCTIPSVSWSGVKHTATGAVETCSQSDG